MGEAVSPSALSSQLTSAAASTSLQETSDQEASLQETSLQEASLQDTSLHEASLQEAESHEALAFAAAYHAEAANSVVPRSRSFLRNLFSEALGSGGAVSSDDRAALISPTPAEPAGASGTYRARFISAPLI